MPGFQEISTEKAHDLVKSMKDVVVVDVRTPEEYVGPCGHIDGSILIPVNEFSQRWRELEAYRTRPIVMICYSGVRSRMTCGFLAKAGFETLYNAPGMMDWHDKNFEVVPGQATPDMPEC